MAAKHETLLDRYGRGGLDRRQLLKGMALATGGALVGGSFEAHAQGTGLAPAMSINHVNVGVKDVKRSVAFYSALLGAKPQAAGANGASQTMYIPGAKPGLGYWMNLNAAAPGGMSRKGIDGWDGTPGVYTHVGFGVTMSTKEFPRIAEEIKKRFPEVKPPNLFKTEAAGQEMMLFDPDGTAIQLVQIEHNGTLTGFSKDTGEKLGPLPDKALTDKGPPGGLAPAMSINHLNIGVKDLKRSTEFYATVLGAKIKDTLPIIATMYLPGATPTSGSWLSLTTLGGPSRAGVDGWDGKPGMYTHAAYGVTIPTKEFPRVAAEIKKQFPEIKQPNLFMTESAGQECVIFDPDGTPIQLIQIEHQGTLTGYSAKTGEKIK